VEAYSFLDESRGVRIYRHDLPQPWINYLSNGSLHAFVSQAGGGFAWWQDPLHYRITRYRSYNLPIDSPGFYVYVKPRDGETWSPTVRPCDARPDTWSATHQPGRTTFDASRGGIRAGLQLFIAPGSDTLVWDLAVSNERGTAAVLDLFAYVELSQLVWREEVYFSYYWRHMLKTWWDDPAAAIIYVNHYQYHPEPQNVPLVFFASSASTESHSGDRDSFLGPYRDERNPVGVERTACGNADLSTGEPCGALHVRVTLAPGESRRVAFFLGVIPGALARFKDAHQALEAELAALRSPGAVDRAREAAEVWWDEHLRILHCSLPDADAQRQIGTWGPVNSVHAARYSRAVNAEAPGIRAYGYRDSCQDMLAIAYRKPAWAAQMLKLLLSKQHRDGHTVGTIPYLAGEPPELCMKSDTHLWLPMLLHAILCESGDVALLEEAVPFLGNDPASTDGEGSTWEHMAASVQFTESLGAHGIPLTLEGDWNDLIGRFSRRGLGESVFAGQQFVYVLRLLAEIAQEIGDEVRLSWFQDCLERQVRALVACAWDGSWWLRGFDDDGVPIGSHTSLYGRIFLNPQTWAVASGVGSRAQWRRGMDSVSELLSTPAGLKKLAPGFETWPRVSDPFTGYGPGCGENGAVFCQAHAWAVWAESLLGNGTRAWEYYRQLVPHLALQRGGLETYRAEPYAWVSNIVGPENPRFGWANVAHITGTAAWMDVIAVKHLLGICPELQGMRIDPCVPSHWSSFTVDRVYRGCTMRLRFENPRGVEKGICFMEIEGVPVQAEQLPFVLPKDLEGKKEARIRVVMGEGRR
jgi:cellobiose phosphorylase